jgi:hypothetical protein
MSILLWLGLFLMQSVLVNVITVVIAALIQTKSPPSPPVLVQFGLALVGIPLAFAAYQLKPLRNSGKWIWGPGVVFSLLDSLTYGLRRMPELLRGQFSSEEPLNVAVNILTASCALYSLTLLVLSHWEKP